MDKISGSKTPFLQNKNVVRTNCGQTVITYEEKELKIPVVSSDKAINSP